MEAAILSESAADKQVIKALFSEIERLQKKMLKIVKTTDGKYYRVRVEDEVNEHEVAQALAEATQAVEDLKAIVPGEQPTPAAAEAQGNADAPVVPAGVSDPATEQPANAATPPAAPVDPATVTLS